MIGLEAEIAELRERVSTLRVVADARAQLGELSPRDRELLSWLVDALIELTVRLTPPSLRRPV